MVTNDSDKATNNEWYLDTGCSNHMTGRKDWLIDLDELVKKNVKFADNSTVKAESLGRVLIHKKNGKRSSINEVLYVPTMHSNLLSLGQLLEKGYKTMLEDHHMKIFYQKGKMIIKAPVSSNRNFKIEIQVQQDQECFSVIEDSKSRLWHKRYGHLNFKRHSMMSNNKIVTRMAYVQQPSKVCDSCCESKQPRKSYNTEIPTKFSAILNLVYYSLPASAPDRTSSIKR